MAELILALDVVDPLEALEVAETCAPFLDRLKLGYPLILRSGLGIVEDLASLGLPLIADFKVADIPNTNRLIAEQVFTRGFDAIICQGFVGRDAIEACVDTARAYGGECYVVAEMSHPGATQFFSRGIAERLAELAVECRADGIIAPGTRPERIRSLRPIVRQRKILAPGIGTQGGDLARVAPLVDGVIVGRTIYEARDPVTVAAELADALKRSGGRDSGR